MSVLIKGMEIPKSCLHGACPLDGASCSLWEEKYWKSPTAPYRKRHPKCPLVPVPPHGRLIDADALVKEFNERIEAAIKWGVNAIADRDTEIKLRAEQAVATFCEASLTAKKQPTIIEAEVE